MEAIAEQSTTVVSRLHDHLLIITMRKSVWLLLALLVLLHHDFWFWNDPTLVAGWVPVGLFYHVALSLLAAVFWLFVVRRACPNEFDEASLNSGSNADAVSGAAEAPSA